ncbi:unnamed protein product, partial [Musa acuminata var. zebrina]
AAAGRCHHGHPATLQLPPPSPPPPALLQDSGPDQEGPRQADHCRSLPPSRPPSKLLELLPSALCRRHCPSSSSLLRRPRLLPLPLASSILLKNPRQSPLLARLLPPLSPTSTPSPPSSPHAGPAGWAWPRRSRSGFTPSRGGLRPMCSFPTRWSGCTVALGRSTTRRWCLTEAPDGTCSRGFR